MEKIESLVKVKRKVQNRREWPGYVRYGGGPYPRDKLHNSEISF